ncbi:MAG: ATP-binding protein, partial [Candidatus Sumerlaeia bacterium]|nr:ATP-binding protein [Candidatus Sumerlaeia bacterium]
IRNINDKIIGILYVGTLKRPFVDTFRKTLMLFLGIAFGTLVVVIYIAYRGANIFTEPLRQMAEIAHRIAEGDYNQKITVSSGDEIGYLAESFNRMTQELKKALKELQDWGKTLEQKVEERTREIERIHRQLLQAEKMASLGKLAAGVAHEINNPMTAILTNSSLLLEELSPDDPRREDVETIVNETMRCRKIVRALLDFARQTKPEKKLINPNLIIERCISLVENQASFRNIKIIKDLDPTLPEIMLDIDQFQQVIINILINAAEAMDTSGGKITIQTKFDKQRNTILISIADTGSGIPEEHLPRLFDPFFTTKEHGTGLGLAISYGIIERHGGKIEVSSKVGEGSTFLIQLPVAT